MKLQIASDLHRELLTPEQRNPQHRKYFRQINEIPGVDLILLAGDIDNGAGGVPWMRNLGLPVVFIPGNHEYYHNTINVGDEILASIHIECRNKIIFLNPGVLETGDIVIIGATLWTDFNLYGDRATSMWQAPHYMNDYNKCKGMIPQWVLERHEKDLSCVVENLEKYKNRKRVVMTHHLPSPDAISPKWRGGSSKFTNPWYASNLNDIIKKYKPDLWIHGHTHESMDSVIEGTRVICNPYGYHGYEVNPQFDPALVVEV